MDAPTDEALRRVEELRPATSSRPRSPGRPTDGAEGKPALAALPTTVEEGKNLRQRCPLAPGLPARPGGGGGGLSRDVSSPTAA